MDDADLLGLATENIGSPRNFSLVLGYDTVCGSQAKQQNFEFNSITHWQPIKRP